MQVQPDYLRQGKYHDAEYIYKLTSDMLKLYDRPSFIIIPDDFSSIGAINAAEEAGISIPEDLSIAGYDGIKMTQIMKPSLTTFEQNTAQIGKSAAELLLKIIRKEKISPEDRQIIIDGKFIKGATVKVI